MKFEDVYRALNPQQKQAVDTIHGPLLVVAGPGTGKTQLLSARVANILAKTDTDPQNILCLTFTEKAATNMKERLLQMIGVAASTVSVKTFHGLGAEIINHYPEYFWNHARLEAAPEATTLEVLDDILSALPLDNPLALKFAGENTLLRDVQHAVARSKEAGLTPDKLKAIVSANLASIEVIEPLIQPLLDARITSKSIADFSTILDAIPDESFSHLIAPIRPLGEVFRASLEKVLEACSETGKTVTLSQWKQEWFEVVDGRRVFRDRRRNQWWTALADVYDAYRSLMHQRGYFDFADMILEVISQLEQSETLLRDLQERYSHILIDEFQDTNDAQFRLTYLIASHPAHEGRPNIMAVGDDDQAIYRFQGANLNNMQAFMNSFRDVQKIVLQDNYRSHQSIIDTADTIAQHIEHRLVTHDTSLDKAIRAVGDAPKGNIEHYLYPTREDGVVGMAEHIRHAFEQGKGTVAVLARGHDSLMAIASALHRSSVPIRYERSSNILEHPAVALVSELLQLLIAIQEGRVEQVNSYLSSILAHPAFGIEAVQLWELALSNRRSGNWLTTIVNSHDDSLHGLSAWLLEVAKAARAQPLALTLEYILGLRTCGGYTSPLREYYMRGEWSDGYVRALSALERLRTMATEFGKGAEPRLQDFVHFLQLNEAHHVMIADQSAFVTGERAVDLMTVHGAKGLEYDTVYIVDTIESIWRPGQRRRTPPQNLESLQEYGEDPDDYGRLMYVAVTRARSNLIVSSYRLSTEGKEVLSTPLVQGIPLHSVERTPGSEVIGVLEQALRWPELDHTHQSLLLRPLLEKYQLSVTHLINFLDIEKGGPRYFLERNLLRLPEVKRASMSFGTAIHAALKDAQLRVNTDRLDISAVQDVFTDALGREYLLLEDEKRYETHGRQLLDDLFTTKKLVLPKGSQPERRLSDIRLGEARLRGDLDRLDISPDELTIVDYKTGRALSLELTSRASGSEGMRAWKHRLQLIFYALLAREAGLTKHGQAVNGQMIYLEAKSTKEFVRRYRPTEDDLVQLRRLITSVWHHIQATDWPDISGYKPDFSGVQRFAQDLIEETP